MESLTTDDRLRADDEDFWRTAAGVGGVGPVVAPPPKVRIERQHLGGSPQRAEVETSYEYRGIGRHFKRALDVSIAVVALLITFPLMVLLAVGIVLSTGGSPLFRQERLGHGGARFTCLKFRTMHRNSEQRLQADPELYQRYVENDFKLPVGEDPRVFALGRFLRASSLDELPQLFNVLAGSMSIVGPRPIVPDELQLYGPWRGAYLAAVPGITGPWQASGRNRIRYPERAQLDADYMRNWSLRNDISIIAKTIPAVLSRDGNH